MVKLGGGLWLFELADPKEASRVLRFNGRFRGNFLSLKKNGGKTFYEISTSFGKEVWVRLVGICASLESKCLENDWG